MTFHNRDPRAYLYENSQWKTGFIGGDYKWLDGDGMSGRNLDARTLFFYAATVNTPAMTMKMVGKGSQYAGDLRRPGRERPERREDLQDQHPRECAGEGFLVGRSVRPANPIGAPDRSAVPRAEQPA